MSKDIILSFFLILLFGSSSAQTNTALSQYMLNGFVLNPAYCGSHGYQSFNVNLKKQWVNIEGAPSSNVVSWHNSRSNVKGLRVLGYGLMLNSDKIGIHSDHRFSASMSYAMQLNDGVLRIGVGGGVARQESNYSKLGVADDPLSQTDIIGSIRPIFSMGVYYKAERYYIGYSAPRLLVQQRRYNSNKLESTLNFDAIPHYITAGFYKRLSDDVVIKPSFLTSYSPEESVQFDINSSFIYQKRYLVGISVRSLPAVVGLFRYKGKEGTKFIFSYSYDYSLSEIEDFRVSSHEIGIEYKIGDRKPMSARHF